MNPILALIIANVIWGAASPIFKFALQNIPPFTLAFIRFFFASLIFLPLAVFYWKKVTVRRLLEIFLVSFFGISLNITFFFLGLPKTASINAPIIASAGPVFLYFLSILFLHEKAKGKVFLGMTIALAGVLVIILSPFFLDGKNIVFGEVQGNLFFVLATLGAVLGTLLGRDVAKKVNPYQMTFVAFAFGGLSFLPLAVGELQSWSFSSLNYQGWLGIIFGVFLSSAAAYFLFYFGLSKIPAQEVGVFAYLDPVIAVLIAIPLLHEYPTVYYFAGAILVFLGIFIAEKRIHYHPFHRLSRKN